MRLPVILFPILTGMFLHIPGANAAFVCPALVPDTERAMLGWQVPGLAIAVVRGGETVYRNSFGVADIETGRPVTRKTLFGIGSITKSMTALGFAVSDAREEIPLDKPVASALPYFPAGITIRHLLSHTAGWPRHDALWYLNAYDRHALPAKLAHLPRYAKPGASFQYNNVPFAAAGEVLPALAGESWDAWIRRVLLAPAGMTSTVTRFSVFRDSQLRATPYFPARAGRTVLPLRDTDPVAPAAGLYSDILDMARYTALLAGSGRLDGGDVVPAPAVRRLWTSTSSRYGLGMRIGQWQGRKLAFHPGFIDGYGARISILPDSGSGVVVLTNMSGETPVARIVSQIALDCLTDAPATDWIARFGHRRPPPKPEAVLPPAAPADRETKAYTGSFYHPAYGRFTFSASGDATLTASFHGRTFDLVYAGRDRWRLTETHWPLRRGLEFAFGQGTDSGFASVAAPLADGPVYRHKAGPIRFRRTALPSPARTPD